MYGHAVPASGLSAPSLQRPSKRSGTRNPVGLACMCVAAMALVWVIAELVPAAQWRDVVVLHDFTLLSRPRVDSVGRFLTHLLKPLLFVIWGVALIAVALARERPRVAAAIFVILAFAPFTSEVLKPLMAHQHMRFDGVHVNPASWPSGHSTAALALAFAAVLAAPPRLRPLVASLGAVFALAVGCSLLILAWHMPSDVLGGYLVATFWTALAVAAVRAANRRWPPAHVHSRA